MLLAGDVGGTKTLFALLDPGSPSSDLVREAALPSRAFATFADAVQTFLDAGPSGIAITAACFGVAGPVVDGRCVTTNLPWVLDEATIAADLGTRHVHLLNDLEAMAHGVLGLPAGAVATLQPGTPRPGNMALIAAGTGLGEALLVHDGDRYVVVASEGGHADFAPRTDLEIELLRYARTRFGHVSWERVLSGPGLFTIYCFLRDTGRGVEPAWLTERLAAGDPSSVISEVALEEREPLCARALELFVSIYGAEAGNLALKALAVGGVWIGGGIAPKIRAGLTDETFLAAFRDKGRFDALMAAIPVRLVLEPRAGLLGAARVARTLATSAG